MRETLATILWEGWTALVLCAAAVFLPGSEARLVFRISSLDVAPLTVSKD